MRCEDRLPVRVCLVSSSRAECVTSSPHGMNGGAAEKEEGLYKTMLPQ